jgi:hypothetical protein
MSAASAGPTVRRRFVIAEPSDRVRSELEGDGTLALFGEGGVFASLEDAVAAFGKRG